MSANKLKLGSAGSFESRWLTTLYRLLTMVVLVALAIAFVPQFASYSNVVNLVRDIFLLCLMGYGVALSMLIGGLDLSIGSVAALSSVLGATIIAGGNPFVGSLTTLVVGAAIGALNGVLIAYLKLPDFIVTFSMMYIVRGLALTYTQGQSIYNLPPSFTWIGKGFLGPVPVPVVISIVTLAILWFVLARTIFGRGIYAVGSSHRAALYTGISVPRKQLQVYVISGVFAAMAGLIAIARLKAADANLGQSWSLDAIAVCVIGGISFTGGEGGILGLLIGGTLIGCINNCINLLGVPSRFQDFFVGFVMILAVTVDHFAKRGRYGARQS